MSTQFPPWLKKRFPASGDIAATRGILEKLGLNTVCQSAHCPNLGECFARKTATLMILGNTCTRNCRFCAVDSGWPTPVDTEEPAKVAEAVAELGLRHAVITSVTRDDLPDGGAGHFAATIRAIRLRTPQVIVEVLTPDFGGSDQSIDAVVSAHPDIYNHNVETVPRLYPTVRPEAGYARSLALLARIKTVNPSVYTKSGLMAGLGETSGEVRDVLQDLRGVGCDIVTIGQYLRPSRAHLEVAEFITPETFAEYQQMGEQMGFLHIAAAPFVRSSFNAQEFSDRHIAKPACRD